MCTEEASLQFISFEIKAKAIYAVSFMLCICDHVLCAVQRCKVANDFLKSKYM